MHDINSSYNSLDQFPSSHLIYSQFLSIYDTNYLLNITQFPLKSVYGPVNYYACLFYSDNTINNSVIPLIILYEVVNRPIIMLL